MHRLALPLSRLRARYDVVVVGSGYGGAVTAAALAGAAKEDGGAVSLCVLERGEEILSGDFPQTSFEGLSRLQLHWRGRRWGASTALYDVRVDDDIAVVQGSGLGGTSLINANVLLEPSPHVRSAPEWPAALEFHDDDIWCRYFNRVRRRLGASRYPGEGMRHGHPAGPCDASPDAPLPPGEGDPRRWPRLRKLLALDRAGVALLGPRPPSVWPTPPPWRSQPPDPHTILSWQTEALFATGGDDARLPTGAPPLSIDLPELAVTFTPHRTFGGVAQRGCTLCGDCVSGCNYQAKNTLPANYLAAAAHRGAEIFCGAGVRTVEPAGDGGWVVRFHPLGTGREAYRPPPMEVRADVVVLAAGSLGSTEILLRSSRAHGGQLALSPRLGERFSGNGDVLAFAYDADVRVDGIGAGRRSPDERNAAGPTITGLIDLRHGVCTSLEDEVIVEEGVIPGPLRLLARVAFPAFGWPLGVRMYRGVRRTARAVWREVVGLVTGGDRGSMPRSLTYLVNGHDGADGRMVLHRDRLRIRWPGVGSRPVFRRIDGILRKASRALGATHVINPAWSRAAGRRLATVHPLGGCPMGDGAEEGVVDHAGRVFRGSAGDDVYDGLVVADGAIVPRSLGSNPLLTIAALAERNAELMLSERGWTAWSEKHHRPPPGGTDRPGLRFSERMVGSVRPRPDRPFAVRRSPLELVLTIESDDLEAMVTDGTHTAHVFGTARWPVQYGPRPLTVTGWFRLFEPVPERVETLRMRYELELRAPDGRVFHFSGRKTIWNDPWQVDIWRDVTRLRFDLFEHKESDEPEPVGEGELRVRLRDLPAQLRSLRTIRAGTRRAAAWGAVRFAAFFARTVGSQFFWIVRPPRVANPYGTRAPTPPVTAPSSPAPRDGHVSKLPAVHRPEVRLEGIRQGRLQVRTGDGAVISLTRYRAQGADEPGGDPHHHRRGPVILAPGFGTSTYAFVISTNGERRSFTDFLTRHGYDVWLMDYRASELSEAAGTLFTVDDIARWDWPAAVEAVLRVRRAEDALVGWPETRSVQLLAHCVGSASLLMSVLGGHIDRGVRSLVCSQALTHWDQPWANRAKARLRIASLLHRMGGWPTFNPDYDVRSAWVHRALDVALRLHTGDRCRNPVCRRIQFLYGNVNRHEQLNTATHDAMADMFNEANLRTFEHLSAMILAGRLVDAEGRDTYLTPHTARRMRLPVGLVQGEANRIFRPRGLERSYRWLTTYGAAWSHRLPQGVELAHGGATRPGLYRKILIEGTRVGQDRRAPDRYGHMDCFIGRHAYEDVYPLLLAELERGDSVARRIAGVGATPPWSVDSPLELIPEEGP